MAINFDKDTRKFVFSFSDYSIKKSLVTTRDFTLIQDGTCNKNNLFLAGLIADTKTVSITKKNIVQKSLNVKQKNNDFFHTWEGWV